MQLLAQSSSSTSDGTTAAVAAMMGGGFLIGSLIGFVIAVAINYVIIKKTGYNPWLSLLILIPGLGGLIILIMLLFTEWPIQREVMALRAQLGGGGGGYVPPGGTYQPGSTYSPGGTYPPTTPPPGNLPPPGGPITPA